jgi:hypothetical protein
MTDRATANARVRQYRQNRKNGVVFTSTCEVCGATYSTHLEGTRFCSRTCSAKWMAGRDVGVMKTVPCVDCGVLVETPARNQHAVRCDLHKEAYATFYRDRRNASMRNRNKAKDGEGPYADWVVFGPIYNFPANHWEVNLAHKRSSNKKTLPYGEYLAAVGLGRKLQPNEEVVFLDGDRENFAPGNISVVVKAK